MDEDARALERQAGGGSLEERAAFLAHRLRSGEVSHAAAELASTLGSGPARLVVGHSDCPVCEEEGVLPGELLNRPEPRVPCPYRAPGRDLIPRLRQAGVGIQRRAGLLLLRHVLRSQGEGAALQEAIGEWLAAAGPNAGERVRAGYRALQASTYRWIRYTCRDPLDDPEGLINLGLDLGSEEALLHVVRTQLAPWLVGEASAAE